MSREPIFTQDWFFNLELLPSPIYLVGGAVRNALLQRQQEYLDLDFVVPTEAVKLARKIAKHYRAGFVVLDSERQIARVVFKQGTLDFAQQEGENLETDLRRRDFTINAIAYDPHSEVLIDPLKGQEDLEKGYLRMVSTQNLQDDPLRLLRAYRQAAQLDFAIEPETRWTIRSLASLLSKVAAERVQMELNYLLKNPSSDWLKAAWEDGLLSLWLENIQEEDFLPLARVEESVQLLGKISQAKPPLAKLACLVSPDPEEAELQLQHLKYSRTEIRTVTTAVKHLPRLLSLEASPMTLREQYFFFLDVGENFPTLALLGIAVEVKQAALAPLMEAYLDPDNQAAHPTPLVTGNDLMRSLNLSPSPQIGKLLTEIQVARIEGKVTNSEEALQFAASMKVSKP